VREYLAAHAVLALDELVLQRGLLVVLDVAKQVRVAEDKQDKVDVEHLQAQAVQLT
jgi:hypothetical protein